MSESETPERRTEYGKTARDGAGGGTTTPDSPSDSTEATVKPPGDTATVIADLREQMGDDSILYTKSKYVAERTGLNSQTVAQILYELSESDVALHVEKWTEVQTPCTWQIEDRRLEGER